MLQRLEVLFGRNAGDGHLDRAVDGHVGRSEHVTERARISDHRRCDRFQNETGTPPHVGVVAAAPRA